MNQPQGPIVININNQERATGRAAQLSNIDAARAFSEIVRTCLGPRAMLKMLLDPMGGVVLTNDGHAILREIDVGHPAARSILEVCRAQDEEVGDGTTSVVVLLGELMAGAGPLLTAQNLHPLTIIAGYRKALEDIERHLESISKPLTIESDAQILKLLEASLGTKLGRQWSDLMCRMALEAVRTVTLKSSTSAKPVIDVKRFVRIEKIPGGDVADSRFIPGVILNKDVLHAQMTRSIKQPRVMLLDCPLEYKKGESQTSVEISHVGDWQQYLQQEDDQIRQQCEAIIALKPTLVLCEKGISGTTAINSSHHIP